MTVRLSYEPSVEGLVSDLLGPEAILVGDPRGLRNRVSWPITLRATGLGSLDGGEIIIVPDGREREILARIDELRRADVAAVAVAGGEPVVSAVPADAAVPVVSTPLASDPRRLKEEIERYVNRRRRELFSLDQRLHRLLVDAALSGASMDRLVELARGETTSVGVEAGAEIWTSEPSGEEELGHALRRAERLLGDGTAAVLRDPNGAFLAAPVDVAGRRRGAAAVRVEEPRRIDESEVLVVTLAAAAAIVLARTPGMEIGLLEVVVTEADSRTGSSGWWCAAFAADSTDVHRLARAVLGDASARGVDPLLATEGDVLYCLLPFAPVASWPTEILQRAGLAGVKGGTSDWAPRPISAREAAAEARDALRLGRRDLTSFDEVELDALLTRVNGWERFVERRLGPLLPYPELLASLDAYLRDRNVTQAASRLSVHRNTLIYRLKRCRDLLGLDIDEPRSSFTLLLAVQLLAAHEAAGSPNPDFDHGS